jgi:outer membrane protein assembly factor BamA
VAQQELRFPLLRGVRFAFPVRWELPAVNGALFADAGWAWDAGRVPGTLVPGYYYSYPMGQAVQGHLGSTGVGFYVGGGPYPVLRWNYSWQTSDFRRLSRRPRTQFMLGYNF